MCPVPAPQHCPSPRELDDLELLLSGALAPRTNFDVSDPGITLALPPELAGRRRRSSWSTPRACRWRCGHPQRAHPARARPTYGPFRRLHLTPAEAREQYDGALLVPVAAPLTDDDLDLIQVDGGRP